MRETLRLAATASIRTTSSLEDTTIGGGKYAIKKDATFLILVWELHRDPAIWGDDVSAASPPVAETNSCFSEGRRIPARANVGWEVRGAPGTCILSLSNKVLLTTYMYEAKCVATRTVEFPD